MPPCGHDATIFEQTRSVPEVLYVVQVDVVEVVKIIIIIIIIIIITIEKVPAPSLVKPAINSLSGRYMPSIHQELEI